MPKGKGKKTVKAVMHSFKANTLHSGSKKGPMVKSRKQAIAIAMHEAGMSKAKPTKVPKEMNENPSDAFSARKKKPRAKKKAGY